MNSLEVGDGVRHDEEEGVGEQERATFARAETRQHKKHNASHAASERHAQAQHASQKHAHHGRGAGGEAELVNHEEEPEEGEDAAEQSD